MLATFHRCMV